MTALHEKEPQRFITCSSMAGLLPCYNSPVVMHGTRYGCQFGIDSPLQREKIAVPRTTHAVYPFPVEGCISLHADLFEFGNLFHQLALYLICSIHGPNPPGVSLCSGLILVEVPCSPAERDLRFATTSLQGKRAPPRRGGTPSEARRIFDLKRTLCLLGFARFLSVQILRQATC